MSADNIVYISLILINDLEAAVSLHKFVDDCTLSETVYELASSVMQRGFHVFNKWSQDNYMKINTWKIKEILIGRIKNYLIEIERAH